MSIIIGDLSVKEAITAIYVGYFNRAPDPSGLDYWIGRNAEYLDGVGGDDIDAGLTLQNIATSFSEQIESRSIYPFFETPSVANATVFIVQVYANLFNRAPDAAGQAYWVNELTSGSQPVGQIILSIISGATDSAAGNDRTTVLNKIDVGCDWVEHAANAGINADPFTNDPEAVQGAKDALDGVDDTQASVDAAKLETDAFIAGYGNDDPVAVTTAATANEDAVLNAFVEATDPDGDTLTFSVAASNTTSNGTLVMNADGSYVYTPNADFVGSDSFTYTVTDGNGGSTTGTVAITVNNTNDAPIASNVIATVAEDGAVVVTPVSSDIDAGDTATYTVASNPTNGTVVANANGTFSYTPNADFNGTDSGLLCCEFGRGHPFAAFFVIDILFVRCAHTTAVKRPCGDVERSMCWTKYWAGRREFEVRRPAQRCLVARRSVFARTPGTICRRVQRLGCGAVTVWPQGQVGFTMEHLHHFIVGVFFPGTTP